MAPKLRRSSFWFTWFIALSSLTVPAGLAESQEIPAIVRDRLANLKGWWKGDGRIYWLDGKTDSFTCRVTHFITEDGRSLKQTARCSSSIRTPGEDNVRVEIKIYWNIVGTTITGTWEETKYNLDGTLSGRVTDNGFEFLVKHGSETANVTAAMSKCEMNVVAVLSVAIKKVTGVMKKDC